MTTGVPHSPVGTYFSKMNAQPLAHTRKFGIWISS
jgi:hypothetical protein